MPDDTIEAIRQRVLDHYADAPDPSYAGPQEMGRRSAAWHDSMALLQEIDRLRARPTTASRSVARRMAIVANDNLPRFGRTGPQSVDYKAALVTARTLVAEREHCGAARESRSVQSILVSILTELDVLIRECDR